MAIANASQHLQVLRGARLVEARRQGPYVHYRLAGENVFRLWQSLRDVGSERLPEVEHVVDTLLASRDAWERIGAEELLARLAARDVVLLDVRPESEYRAGHIRGARSVPLNRLAGENVFRLWQSLRDVGSERLPEVEHVVDTFLADRDAMERIGAEELLARLATSVVVMLDVRPEPEYRAGHIRDARSVPIDRLAQALGSLPRDVEVIAYCRGPYCVWSDEAVELLRARGFHARRLTTGFPDWRAAGLPVDTGRDARLTTSSEERR